MVKTVRVDYCLPVNSAETFLMRQSVLNGGMYTLEEYITQVLSAYSPPTVEDVPLPQLTFSSMDNAWQRHLQLESPRTVFDIKNRLQVIIEPGPPIITSGSRTTASGMSHTPSEPVMKIQTLQGDRETWLKPVTVYTRAQADSDGPYDYNFGDGKGRLQVICNTVPQGVLDNFTAPLPSME
jgi:hypothetical protein